MMPPDRLPIGTTYANWKILGLAPKSKYHTECPLCGKPQIKNKMQMEHATRCITCFRKKKNPAVALRGLKRN